MKEKIKTASEQKGTSLEPEVNGAEALLRCLIEEGVDTIFGYPGGAIMPVYDKLLDYSDRLRHVLARHEQGAAHAAQAYAMVTGKPGVCFATSGPGATNLVTGIANAFLDSVPVVFITAQVTSGLIGTDGESFCRAGNWSAHPSQYWPPWRALHTRYSDR